MNYIKYYWDTIVYVPVAKNVAIGVVLFIASMFVFGTNIQYLLNFASCLIFGNYIVMGLYNQYQYDKEGQIESVFDYATNVGVGISVSSYCKFHWIMIGIAWVCEVWYLLSSDIGIMHIVSIGCTLCIVWLSFGVNDKLLKNMNIEWL